MVEPILHFIIPVIILLAFKPNVDRKLVFGLAILTIVSDFDYFIGHRSLFHNIFFVLIFSFIIYLMFKYIVNKDIVGKKIENKNAFYISLYYIFFHLLLDISRPGIPFLYPFTNKLFTFNFNINLAQVAEKTSRVGSLAAKSYVATQPIIEATKDQIVPLVTNFGFVLLVVVLLFFLFEKNILKNR